MTKTVVSLPVRAAARRLPGLVLASSLVIGVSGCQNAPPDISADRAQQFQSDVLSISTAVAAGSLAEALDEVESVEAELDAAAADGTISFSRHQRIDAALAAVKSDLQAAIAAATPAHTPSPVSPANDDAGNSGGDSGGGTVEVTTDPGSKATPKKPAKPTKPAKPKGKQAKPKG